MTKYGAHVQDEKFIHCLSRKSLKKGSRSYDSMIMNITEMRRERVN
jgi:hypothetical protein